VARTACAERGAGRGARALPARRRSGRLAGRAGRAATRCHRAPGSADGDAYLIFGNGTAWIAQQTRAGYCLRGKGGGEEPDRVRARQPRNRAPGCERGRQLLGSSARSVSSRGSGVRGLRGGPAARACVQRVVAETQRVATINLSVFRRHPACTTVATSGVARPVQRRLRPGPTRGYRLEQAFRRRANRL
jgi:hypothetical protein